MVFLYDELHRERPKQVIEIGTASGVSTALILAAMAGFDKSDPLPDNRARTVISYDYSRHLYFDKTNLVGAAIDEIYPTLRANLQMRNPYTVVDFPKFPWPGSIDFIFLDAN